MHRLSWGEHRNQQNENSHSIFEKWNGFVRRGTTNRLYSKLFQVRFSFFILLATKWNPLNSSNQLMLDTKYNLLFFLMKFLFVTQTRVDENITWSASITKFDTIERMTSMTLAFVSRFTKSKSFYWVPLIEKKNETKRHNKTIDKIV